MWICIYFPTVGGNSFQHGQGGLVAGLSCHLSVQTKYWLFKDKLQIVMMAPLTLTLLLHKRAPLAWRKLRTFSWNHEISWTYCLWFNLNSKVSSECNTWVSNPLSHRSNASNRSLVCLRTANSGYENFSFT